MIVFEGLNEEFVAATTQLHVQLMPEDLASGLGTPTVRDLFHGGTVKFPGGVGVVALCDGAVVGFCLAQIDFRAFSAFQRTRPLWFYSRVLAGLVRRPDLLPHMFGANQYLALHPKFTNIGPLLVAPEFRNVKPPDVERFSLAGELARRVFREIAARAPDLPVLAMIRPNNLPSITATSQGARQAQFKLKCKYPIYLGKDERLVFEYQFVVPDGKGNRNEE